MNRTDRVLLIVVGVLIVVALLAGPVMAYTMGWMMPAAGLRFGRPGFGAGFEGWRGPWVLLIGLGILLRIAFWGIVVGGVVLLLRALGRSRRQAGAQRPHEDSALELLRRRYAAGEITEAQFEEMRRVLDRGRTDAST